MIELWFVAAGILFVAAPVVGLRYTRARREAVLTVEAAHRLATDLRSSSAGLGEAAAGTRSSFERLERRLPG